MRLLLLAAGATLGLIVLLVSALQGPGSEPAAAAGEGGVITELGLGTKLGQGSNGSVAIGADGNPIIANVNGISNAVQVTLCGDPNCASGNTTAEPGGLGIGGCCLLALALDAVGKPVVGHRAKPRGIEIVRCGNASCTSGNSVVLPDSASGSGGFMSLALDANGNPVVSTYDSDADNLKILRCGDPTCGSGNTFAWPDYVGDVGSGTSLALDANGHPVVSYYARPLGELRVLHCGNPACTSSNTITIVDSVRAHAFSQTSLALDAAGNPIVAYYDPADGGLGNLKIASCGNQTCTSGNTIVTADTNGDVGKRVSLALDPNGHPSVAYYDDTNDNLKVLHCGNPTCTSANTIATPDASGEVLDSVSLALDASGHPVVNYASTTGSRLLHCANEGCVGAKSCPAECPTITPIPTATATATTIPCSGTCPTPTATPTTEPDSDLDGCTDQRELGPDEQLGGRRDPANSFDFYDVDLSGQISLFSDIFAVSFRFGMSTTSPQVGSGYAPEADRSAPPTEAEEPDQTKREPWDLGPPDGAIDLFNDIFGVAFQFGHSCL